MERGAEEEVRRDVTTRSFPDRDWSKLIRDLKGKLGLADRKLAKRIGIPCSTLENLKRAVVLQPLHSTGEKILRVYRVQFPEGKWRAGTNVGTRQIGTPRYVAQCVISSVRKSLI